MKYISLTRRLEIFYKNKISKKPVKYAGFEFIFLKPEEFQFPKGANFIEIGSERGTGSTLFLAKLATEKGWNFSTVDVNPETTAAAQVLLDGVNPAYKAVNEYGEKYLAAFDGQIDLVYLDAFDVPGPWHSQERLDAYKSRGEVIDWESCWKMHYDCCVSFVEKVPVGGAIVFDDVFPTDDNDKKIMGMVDSKYLKWGGKGTTAIPLLIENGFELVHYKPNGAVFKRTSK